MNTNLMITAFLGMMGMVLGAFATHTFKGILSSDAMESLMTGIRYQIYHVIVLLFTNTYQGFSCQLKNQISVCFFAGILFFSGSIYAIYLFGIPAKNIWFITPFGGLLLIAGWFLIFFTFLKKVFVEKKE